MITVLEPIHTIAFDKASLKPYKIFLFRIIFLFVKNKLKIKLEILKNLCYDPISLRRSIREMKSSIPNDYVMFLQEHKKNNWMIENDSINFYQAVQDSNSKKWNEAMNKECNKVWKLVTLLEDTKSIGCKWIFKIKRDSKGDILQ